MTNLWLKHMEDAINALSDGNPGLSEYYWSQALVEARSFGLSDRRVSETLEGLADAQVPQNKLGEAERNYATAIDLVVRQRGQNADTARLKNKQAQVAYLRYDFHRAASLAEESLAIYEVVSGATHDDVGSVCYNLGNCYENLRQFEKSENMYKRALAVKTKTRGTTHPHVLEILARCASILEKNHKKEEADMMLKFVRGFRSNFTMSMV